MHFSFLRPALTFSERADYPVHYTSFDSTLNPLATFTAEVVENRIKESNEANEANEAFFAARYDESNLIGVVMVVGDKIISNYTHNLAQLDIDFPVAPELEKAHA
ncbi:MAG: hypothetical protein MK081_08345 [Flavobacteriales bacterium]|nr:hypothetical protein [Flavobacteriales bacterium]